MTVTTSQAGGAAVAVGLVVTLLVSVFPQVPVAIEQPVLRVVLDTVVSLTAMLLALLVFGRYVLDRHTSDLVLAYALAWAGALNLLFAVLPQLSPLSGTSLVVLAWAPVVGRLLLAAGFALAAWIPRERRSARVHPGPRLALVVLTTAGLLGAAIVLLAPDLPASAVPDLRPSGPVLEVSGDQAVLRALRLAAMVLYALAAVGFLRRGDDRLAPALVASCVLSAFGRLNLAVLPSLYPQWVYAGDLLRVSAYAVLLAAAVGQIRRYWGAQARLVHQEERRRLARTLHDGVAQEISVIAAQTRLWASGRTAMEPRLLAGAAERALDESRAAIQALTGDIEEPLDIALLRMADDLQGRLGVSIRTEVHEVPHRQREVRDAVVRATREAVTNAARHSGADTVDVRLTADERIRVTIRDDGAGFDPANARAGYGLENARARMSAVHGTLAVLSEPGEGTTVTVDVP